MKLDKKTISTFLILLLATIAIQVIHAQSFTASASRTKVAVGEPFQIDFSVNGSASGFKAPSLKEFDVYSGPNNSSSVQIVNGNMSQTTSISFVIAAKKEGKFTIGPASATVGGSKKESNTLTIEVVKGNAAAAQNNGKQNQSNSNYASDDNLFARTSVSKSKAYLGEQITITQKIYTRLNIVGLQEVKYPSYNGFWSQDVPQKQIQVTKENIDGVPYTVAELKRSFIFAQRSGTIEIEPIEAECVIRQRSKQAQSLFDQFFGGGGVEDVVIKAKSKPVKIEVLPLPENNKPADYSGAVGNFSFKASMNKNKVKTNEAVNLTITINGAGNLKLIDALKLNIPSDIEAYDPKITDNVGINNSGISGSKTFDYLLIPRQAGEFKIDNIQFSYFDADKKTYVSLPSPDFIINVEKGKDDESTSIVRNTVTDKKNIAVIGNDIHYIKTDTFELLPINNSFWGSTGYYVSLFSPLLLFSTIILVRRKQIQDNSNTVALKSKKANKVAKQRLSLAEKHSKENNKDAFYEEIFKALYGYLSDKFNIPFSELNKETIKNTLVNKGIDSDTTAQLIAIIDSCEYARYAPAAVSNNLTETYTSASNIITSIENKKVS